MAIAVGMYGTGLGHKINRFYMKKYLNIFVIISVLILTSCRGGLTFRAYDLPYMYPEEAPVAYKMGWEHGCKTGFSTYGNTFYRTFYNFTQDVSMIGDETYIKAWNDSLSYCRSYVNRYLAGEDWNSNEGVLSSQSMELRSKGLRDNKVATTSQGTDASIFHGLNAPGWGSHSWGQDVTERDWLGRSGGDKVDWLGRTGAYQ